ncbi:MAG TPA: glycosyltransferase [Chryseolinea sp.]
MVLLTIIVFASYFILLGVLILGWSRGIRNNPILKADKSRLFISVVIPVRNEESNIGRLLADFEIQDHSDFEIIVVDDHSEDTTIHFVREATARNPRLRVINNAGDGKKAALTSGIKAAKGPIIVTTDADCRISREWLSVFAQFFEDKAVMMAFGGVRMEAKSLFSNIQSLEFASLIGTGMAMASWNYPVMCNGANLAFRKSVFEEVDGYTDNLHIPSGDDEFLMRKILALYPTGIKPVFHRQSVVSTVPNSTFKEFFQQRIRWAGKWSYNNSLLSRTLALFVVCFQLITLLLPLFVTTGWMDPETCVILVLLKVSFEFLFLERLTKFLSLRWNWLSFAIIQVLYPVYVIVIGVLSNFNSFEWKGRKLKSLTISNKMNKEILG